MVDGDTIETSAGTVRIIGIDTPERGQCGYDDAKAVVTTLIAQGDELVLGLPEGQNDQDKYGRILRYVTTKSGVDLGLAELRAGQAVARFDSSDGYPAHPRERAYHDAQLATLADGRVVTTACAKTAEPAPTAAPAPTPAPTQTPKAPVAEPPQWGSGWWTQYRSCSALKKNSVGHPKGPFDRNNPDEAQIYNWFEYGTGYHGDGDGDGLACE